MSKEMNSLQKLISVFLETIIIANLHIVLISIPSTVISLITESYAKI